MYVCICIDIYENVCVCVCIYMKIVQLGPNSNNKSLPFIISFQVT